MRWVSWRRVYVRRCRISYSNHASSVGSGRLLTLMHARRCHRQNMVRVRQETGGPRRSKLYFISRLWIEPLRLPFLTQSTCFWTPFWTPWGLERGRFQAYHSHPWGRFRALCFFRVKETEKTMLSKSVELSTSC